MSFVDQLALRYLVRESAAGGQDCCHDDAAIGRLARTYRSCCLHLTAETSPIVTLDHSAVRAPGGSMPHDAFRLNI